MATAILQARVGSSRLPGKALLPMAGRPMLWYAVRTLQEAAGVDRLVLAVPDNPADDPLAARAAQWGVPCVRGPEADVLGRFVLAAAAYPDDVYLRATGDNPVLDRDNPLRTLQHLRQGGWEYACEIGLPLGSLVEAFSAEALARAQCEATLPEDREHVTLFMKRNGNCRASFPACPAERRWPDLRLTVDTADDFARVARVVEALYADGEAPDFMAVLQFCREYRLHRPAAAH